MLLPGVGASYAGGAKLCEPGDGVAWQTAIGAAENSGDFVTPR